MTKKLNILKQLHWNGEAYSVKEIRILPKSAEYKEIWIVTKDYTFEVCGIKILSAPPVRLDAKKGRGITSVTGDNVLAAKYLRQASSESKTFPCVATFPDGSTQDVVCCYRPTRAEELAVINPMPASSKTTALATEEQNAEPVSQVTPQLLSKVQRDINEKLDCKVRRVPTVSQIFIYYCKDKLTLKRIERKHRWSYRTIKSRMALLKGFLWREYKLTPDAFFVDGSVFADTERELKRAAKASYLYRKRLIENDRDDSERDY